MEWLTVNLDIENKLQFFFYPYDLLWASLLAPPHKSIMIIAFLYKVCNFKVLVKVQTYKI